MLTALFTAAKAKEIGLTALSFIIKHWKELLIAVLILTVLYKGAHYFESRGRTKANAEWVEAHNKSVTAFNKALEEIRKGSVKDADSVEDHTKEIVGRLDDIGDTMQRIADDQRGTRAKDPVASKCPNVIDLNGKMPKEFAAGWNAQSVSVEAEERK